MSSQEQGKDLGRITPRDIQGPTNPESQRRAGTGLTSDFAAGAHRLYDQQHTQTKQSFEEDIQRAKDKDTFRDRANQLLKINKETPERQKSASTPNKTFLVETIEGAIRSLESQDFFNKTSRSYLFPGTENSRNIAKNMPHSELMNKAEEHIESIMKKVDGRPKPLTQQQRDFISRFLIANAHREKGQKYYIDSDPKKFAESLGRSKKELMANPEVQSELLGITKDSFGKITVDITKFNVDWLDLSELDLSNVKSWEIKDDTLQPLGSYYLSDTNLHRAQEALHNTQHLGIVAENSDLCKRVLDNYVNCMHYKQNGRTHHKNIYDAEYDLSKYTDQLLEENKTILKNQGLSSADISKK